MLHIVSLFFLMWYVNPSYCDELLVETTLLVLNSKRNELEHELQICKSRIGTQLGPFQSFTKHIFGQKLQNSKRMKVFSL